jgi:tRNA 2-thiouridine synthesizing protein A
MIGTEIAFPPPVPSMSDLFLDTKGLNCPLPVLRARRAMKDMAPAEVIEIHATDPGAVQDFEAFCETTGDALLDSREEAGTYIFVIRKRG